MFGFKLVKEEDYVLLEGQLRNALDEVLVKDSEIKRLHARIQELELDNRAYRERLADRELDGRSETILLTDVAETPLVEEKKSARKPRKTVKKTEGSTIRRKVVHKTEEV